MFVSEEPPPSISILTGEGKQIPNVHTLGSDNEQHAAFIVNRPTTPTRIVPFVVVTPHAGIFTPNGFEDTLADNVNLLEVLTRGDAFTDWLTVHAPLVGATQLISTVAPSFLNVGRATTSINPSDVSGTLTNLPFNPEDPYVSAGQGQGLVAVKTLYGNHPIYRSDHIPDEAEIRSRIDNFYTPFHDHLEQAVNDNIGKHGYSLLFDIHSCPSVGTPKDKDAGEERADIIFGNKADHGSASSELLDLAIAAAELHGYSVAVNAPYAGGFNTQKYAHNPSGFYEAMPFGALGSESLQIEYNRRSIGLDEENLIITDMKKFLKMQFMSTVMMNDMAHYVRRQIGMTP